MILTKTFKPRNAGVELRIYIATTQAHKLGELIDEVVLTIRKAITPLDFAHPIEVQSSSLSLLSNRNGIYFSYHLSCRMIDDDIPTILKQITKASDCLAATGWNESKEN